MKITNQLTHCSHFILVSEEVTEPTMESRKDGMYVKPFKQCNIKLSVFIFN